MHEQITNGDIGGVFHGAVTQFSNIYVVNSIEEEALSAVCSLAMR
jgi:hypothetical protein